MRSFQLYLTISPSISLLIYLYDRPRSVYQIYRSVSQSVCLHLSLPSIHLSSKSTHLYIKPTTLTIQHQSTESEASVSLCHGDLGNGAADLLFRTMAALQNYKAPLTVAAPFKREIL